MHTKGIPNPPLDCAGGNQSISLASLRADTLSFIILLPHTWRVKTLVAGFFAKKGRFLLVHYVYTTYCVFLKFRIAKHRQRKQRAAEADASVRAGDDGLGWVGIDYRAPGEFARSAAESTVYENLLSLSCALEDRRLKGVDGVLYSMPVSDLLTFLIAAVVIRKVYRELDANQAEMSIKPATADRSGASVKCQKNSIFIQSGFTFKQ